MTRPGPRHDLGLGGLQAEDLHELAGRDIRRRVETELLLSSCVPRYAGPDGRWYVLGYAWLSIDAIDRRSALEATRAAVAEWLGVDPAAVGVQS
jgi:hypothetical protein